MQPGDVIDRYRLVEPLGEGGQGSVWRAEDPLRPDLHIAVKLVSLQGALGGTVDRFRREARALARLSHPSLPRCYGLFEDLHRDVIGFALDLVEGSPLSDAKRAAELSPMHRRWILVHLADALRFVHEAGLVHRDVKPQNVLVADGFEAHPEDPAGVKLVDFGIAAEPNNPSPLTAPGGVIGTAAFLAPEILDVGHFRDKDSPAQSGPERDVFAFGVLAFELLRGHHPTGLPEGATMGDYIVAYRSYPGEGEGFPPDTAGDPYEVLYQRALALRPSRRAKDGAALCTLLKTTRAGAGLSRGVRPSLGKSLGIQPVLGLSSSQPLSVQPRSTSVRGVMRRTAWPLYALMFLVGGAAFILSFYFVFFGPQGTASQLGAAMGSAPAEEPPSPDPPPPPARPAPVLSAKPAASTPLPGAAVTAPPAVTPAAVFTGPVNCPAGMVPVRAAKPSCIDQREVTVAQYRTCAACGPAKDAFWPGPTFTADKAAEQTKNCSANQPGSDDKPITCVTYLDAATYCASLGKRLPSMDEWRAARSSLTICQAGSGICPLFEWSTDVTRPTYRMTRGPSWRYPAAVEGSNLEIARNDDLGFRCASAPQP